MACSFLGLFCRREREREGERDFENLQMSQNMYLFTCYFLETVTVLIASLTTSCLFLFLCIPFGFNGNAVVNT